MLSPMLTPLLDRIDSPCDLKIFTQEELCLLCEELRHEIIRIVAKNGGHLGANLGVIELTVALHHVFKTPTDKLIFDIGHQSYAHKLLTGRRSLMERLRQVGGASGFTKRDESPHDPFGAGHSSTSISAALGFAVARDLKCEDHHVIAVIGDGAMSAGMAYEGLNNAGIQKSRLLVILNDNDMSIAPPVGAMSQYLSRLLSSNSYRTLRKHAKDVAAHLPPCVEKVIERVETYTRNFLTGGTLFEELGFYYVGPIDGHDFTHLLPVLRSLKEHPDSNPILLHVVTQKGRGYKPAEKASDRYHGVSTFNISTGQPLHKEEKRLTFTEVFSQCLIKEAEQDPMIVAITAAMPQGTGLDPFKERFPNRFFDVGIAEQHAVTFAAALACEGFKPVVAIYSTFLQRAYDQIIHDVVVQRLPVRFMIDRAGISVADGETHAGIYDPFFLGCLDPFVLMAPSDEAELCHMIKTSLSICDRPSAVRYPKGYGLGVELPKIPQILPIEPRILQQGREGDGVIEFFGFEEHLKALERSKEMERHGKKPTLIDLRFWRR